MDNLGISFDKILILFFQHFKFQEEIICQRGRSLLIRFAYF